MFTPRQKSPSLVYYSWSTARSGRPTPLIFRQTRCPHLIDTTTLQQKSVMRCLFAHKWIRKVPNVRSALPVRTCERCGTMQRGIYDPFWRDIAWETMRERAYTKSVQIQIARLPASPWETIVARANVTWERVRFFRKPSSWLDQLTHSLRLRRNRMTDRVRSGKRSASARH